MQIKRLTGETSALKQLTDFYIPLMELSGNSSGEKLMIQIGNTELVFKQASAADLF